MLRSRFAGAALLAGPSVLAFFSGGYFDTPRAWAGAIAWALAAFALITRRRAVRFSRFGTLALLALALLGAWTLVSIVWAPLAGSAYHAAQITVLYLGAVVAAAVLLRDLPERRVAEPALAAGTLIVIGYGLSERWLPGLLHFARSVSAQGRLEQPLTYWNAMGELAAIGFVLCARIAGDHTRPLWLRHAGVAASVPLATGLYISFSRGALFACFAGLIALLALAYTREQVRAVALVLLAGVAAALACSPFHGFTSLAGSLGTRELQGAVVLASLVVIGLAAVVAQRLLERSRPAGALRLPRWAPRAAATLICAALALAIAFGAKERANNPLSAGAGRFVTLQSNRYAYWRVAMKAFGHQPVIGVGAGGWAVWWLRDRPFAESAQDAHSLPLQTLAELGVVGLALLLAFFAAAGFTAREAQRLAPADAAGPIAGIVVWLAHAPLDWDWQMPAVTLVVMILTGALIATAGAPDRP